MQTTFLSPAGVVLFARDDMEQGNWTQEEYTVNATFPFISGKVIERGQRFSFRDPATGSLEMFEVRNVTNIEPEHYQQIIAEHIAVSELSDEHINTQEITDQTPEQALTTVLTGTLWAVGNVDLGTVAERNRILSEISTLGLNGNVDLTDRPIISPETMHNAGYTDFDGDYATLYSMTYTEALSNGDMITTLFTPIQTNGTVLSQQQIDNYVFGLHDSSASISALKSNDSLGLLIHAINGEHIAEMDAIAETAHDLSDEWETLTTGGVSSADIARGSVWQAVGVIAQTWNVYIVPRVTVNNAGSITGRYLDVTESTGVWRGLRLSIDKNMSDASVVYDDYETLTALYGYGGSVEKAQASGDDTQETVTFADDVWEATSEHPAKPAGQTYLEDPQATALYGRNGRPRFGFYQNGDIKDGATLLEKTWEALKQTNKPKISITGTVADLYRLGYKDQPIRLHDLAIVDVPETGESFYLQIIRCDVDLIDPTATRPEIGSYIANIIYINNESNESSGGGGGGGGRGQNKEKYDEATTYSAFEKTNELIGMVVGTRNGTNYIKAGEIALSINSQTGESKVLLQADVIDIDGLITALVSKSVVVENMTMTSNAYMLGNMTYQFRPVSWQSKTVVTGITCTNPHKFIYGTTSDPLTPHSTASGRLVTAVSTATINYLGMADT